MSKTLYLLDGMALVYRAHFAFITRPILTSKGRNTSAIYGFTNTLLELLENRRPTHIAVAFDTSAPTARHELYPEYKAQREAMPEDLATAIPDVKRLLAAFNVPVLERDGFEADDIIGTLARRAEKQGYDEVFMVTPDKDYGQLVDTHTRMYKPGRKGGEVEILGPEEICAQWGIEDPEQVIDILGLMGDSSDNIPGVPGIGPKTAQKLIAEFGSVEQLIARVDEVKGKMKDKIKENEEQARLSRKLVVIDCDVPLELAPDDLILGERDDAALQKLFIEFEFNSIGKRLYGEGFNAGRGQAPKEVQGDLFASASAEMPLLQPKLKKLADVPHDYRRVDGLEGLNPVLEALLAVEKVCFDLETTGLDVLDTEIVGIAFSLKPGAGWFVGVTPENEKEVLRALSPFWAHEGILKIGHNLKFDLGVLFAKGVEVRGPFADTMIAHALLEPDQRHGMDELAAAKLNYAPIPISDLIGPKGKPQGNMRDVEPQKLTEYAVEDTDVTLRLYEHLMPKLDEAEQRRVFEQIEMPLVPVLTRMELEGIRLDTEDLAAFSERLGRRLEVLEKRVFELAGESFNLNSPKQLGVILFDKLKIAEKVKKTKTGQYSTNEQTLQGLAGKHEIIDIILEYREAGKLKSTYVDALPRQVHPKTGRVHTRYMQTGAATGRLSSIDPNLQNIPIRTELGREIRKAFVPRGEGFVLLAADYSQIELRLMAHLSGDKAMREAFEQGLDIHAATAAKVYGVSLEDVTSDMRRKAKMVNFGIIYGISAFGLSQRLDIPRTEAKEIIDAYFAQYPGVKAYMKRIPEEARSRGYVETLCGRRREIRDIDSRNQTIRQGAERTAINSPIQGTAADMIKLAMVSVDQLLREKKARSRLLLQVHDELVFDLAEEEADDLMPAISAALRDALTLDVPVVVEMGTGPNWLAAH
ncbi:MAG: DNA polymerase I [Verrucomicrobia bacterium]|nr:DNA polymerase I [Verrucomicrobiota bacterium]MCH8511043.1 DNA polymerase I [Kiritimatiellia bacterium]